MGERHETAAERRVCIALLSGVNIGRCEHRLVAASADIWLYYMQWAATGPRQLTKTAANARMRSASRVADRHVREPLAQLVEHLPFKQGVARSSRARLIGHKT